jgi:hypothetical protein
VVTSRVTVAVVVVESNKTKVGLRVAVSPADGEAVRVTFPLKPFSPVSVIIVVPSDPAAKLMDVLAGAIEKSTKPNVAPVVWLSGPPLHVPMIVTGYVFGVVELQESVAVLPEAERGTVAGLIALQVSPLGRGVSASETVPVSPLIAVTVIVEVEVGEEPTVAGAGDAAVMVNSGPTRAMVVECTIVVKFAVTVTIEVPGPRVEPVVIVRLTIPLPRIATVGPLSARLEHPDG